MSKTDAPKKRGRPPKNPQPAAPAAPTPPPAKRGRPSKNPPLQVAPPTVAAAPKRRGRPPKERAPEPVAVPPKKVAKPTNRRPAKTAAPVEAVVPTNKPRRGRPPKAVEAPVVNAVVATEVKKRRGRPPKAKEVPAPVPAPVPTAPAKPGKRKLISSRAETPTLLESLRQNLQARPITNGAVMYEVVVCGMDPAVPTNRMLFTYGKEDALFVTDSTDTPTRQVGHDAGKVGQFIQHDNGALFKVLSRSKWTVEQGWK